MPTKVFPCQIQTNKKINNVEHDDNFVDPRNFTIILEPFQILFKIFEQVQLRT